MPSTVVHVLASFLIILSYCSTNVYGFSKDMGIPEEGVRTSKKGAATVIDLGEHGTQELLDRWLSQAMSGLFAAVAQKHLGEADKFEQDILHNCSQIAETVPEHARCVARLLKVTEEQIRETNSYGKKKNPTSLRRKMITLHKESEQGTNSDLYRWEGSFGMFRSKRETKTSRRISTRASYDLSHRYDESPFSQVAKYLTKSVKALKNKDRAETWQETMVQIRRTAEEERVEKDRKKAMLTRLRAWIDNTPKKLEDGWRNEALEQLDDQLSDKEKMMKKANATEEVRIPLKVLRESIKLGLSLSGQDVSKFDNKTLKLVSPRFFSVVQDQAEEDIISLLSPSLFSLHSEGDKSEQLMSLPHLLKTLNRKEQQAWMDFIVEASGVSDAVQKTQAIRRNQKDAAMRTPDGTPLFFNKNNLTTMYGKEETRKVDVFEDMAKKYSDKQKMDLDQQGFAFMNEKQVEVMYGKGSPYHDPERIVKYREFTMLDDDTRHVMLKNEIKEIAGKAHAIKSQPIGQLAKSSGNRRSKRNIILSPVIATPLLFSSALLSNTWIVLSPLVFSPVILSPAVLGPIILSPWVFIPVILSPRVLSPLILNPLIFSPIILSPLVLHPMILSPGIFNPLILSPFVLSPFILSPQVFTPVILSPFALSPLILNPMVGSPLILSPFVLSPIILSPQVLFAVVLSPYALSPLVESKLIASEVVLSPSFLS